MTTGFLTLASGTTERFLDGSFEPVWGTLSLRTDSISRVIDLSNTGLLTVEQSDGTRFLVSGAGADLIREFLKGECA